MKLSENFSLQELTKSETALRFGMKNDPSEADIQNLKTLCEKVLQPIRDNFKTGVKVNSGYRHPEVNSCCSTKTKANIMTCGSTAFNEHIKAFKHIYCACA